jgi:hypothetical protein
MTHRSIRTVADSFAAAVRIQQAVAILKRLLSHPRASTLARNKDSKPGSKTNQRCAEFIGQLTGKYPLSGRSIAAEAAKCRLKPSSGS